MSDPAVVDEPDLDFHDELPDADAEGKLIDAPRYTRTERAPYHEDLPVMWAAVRAGRRSKARPEVGGATHIVRTDQDYIGDPPPAVARLFKRLQAGGWAVRMLATTVHTDDLLYVGQTDDHDPGDVRTPAYDSRHFFVQGVLIRQEVRLAWFKAHWERRGDGGNKYGHAQTWDVAYGRDWEPSATGFEDWVSIFTPKPAKR